MTSTTLSLESWSQIEFFRNAFLLSSFSDRIQSLILLSEPGFHITGCPGQPFLPAGQTKVNPWLPDRATKSFAIFLYNYVVGQPKYLVGQPQSDIGWPTGNWIWKLVKPCSEPYKFTTVSCTRAIGTPIILAILIYSNVICLSLCPFVLYSVFFTSASTYAKRFT